MPERKYEERATRLLSADVQRVQDAGCVANKRLGLLLAAAAETHSGTMQSVAHRLP